MADVALVPEGHVLKGSNGVAAQHPGQTADPLTADRVALVGHGGAALLPLGEVLLHFQHVGALEVANLGGEALQGGAHQGEGLHVVGMAIAGDHLGAGGVGSQPEDLAGDGFHLGIGVGIGAHGAAHLAHGHILLKPFQPDAVPLGFRQPAGHLEPEGDRFAVDGMGAADHFGALMGPGQFAQGIGQGIEFGAQQGHGTFQLQGHARVQHVAAGHAHMDVTSGITNVLIHVGEEGDHVVAHLGFDFEDALHLEAGLRLDGVESLLGHATEPAVSFGGSDLHIKPALEFRLLTPDGSHLRKGVTLNHRRARLNNPTNLWGRLRATCSQRWASMRRVAFGI